jgi:peptidoglycan/LPS O-acetylase OafA/YrhL
MTSRSSHILTLDAIRGLAAISVLLIHIGWMGGNRSLARFGYLSVDLFFVVSGFVIGRAYEEKLLSGMRWHRFMLLRVARLYPSMFLGLVAGLVAYFVVPAGTYRLGWYSIGHLFLIPDLTADAIFPLNGALWSLFFELAINALHGLVVRRLSILKLTVFVLAMGAWWAFAASSSGNWGGGWNRESFVSGFARVGWSYGAGLLLHRLTLGRWRIPAIVPIASAALLLFLPAFGGATPRIALSVFVLFPLIVALAVASEVPPFGRGIARWLGAISYPLYAIHHPLLVIVLRRFEISRGARWTAVAAAIMAVATVVAYAWDAPVRKRLAALVAGTD